MSVSEKSDFGSGIEKAVQSLRGREDVFVFILKRAVYQNDAVGGQRPMGQSGKPGKIFCAQLRTRPVHGGFRHGIEIRGVHQPGDRFVMIAPNGFRPEFSKTGGNLIWIAPIADGITERHGNVPASVCRIESSGESGSVRVQITKNKN